MLGLQGRVIPEHILGIFEGFIDQSVVAVRAHNGNVSKGIQDKRKYHEKSHTE